MATNKATNVEKIGHIIQLSIYFLLTLRLMGVYIWCVHPNRVLK